MIIPQIIRALLEEDSVNISEFGTFSVVKHPSLIKDDIVYPPQNLVEFQYSKETVGFDFVSKLSKWKQLRIDEAQTQISEWMKLLEYGLEHNKSVFFDNFGTFSKDSSGKIVFQSMLIPELNIENEGLEPVYIPLRIKKQEPQKTEEPVIDKREILVKKSKKYDKTWFAVVIIASVILLLALFFKEKMVQLYKNYFIKKEVAELFADEDIDNVDDETDTIEVSKIEKIVTVVEMNKAPKKDSISHSVYLSFEKGKYYVIAGSFMKDEDALRHIKEKKLEKYHAKIIVEPQNPRKRVCIGVFDNESDALKFVAQTDKNYWVLK